MLTDDDPDLAIIRRKKMAQMIKREKQVQAAREQEEKVGVERAKLLGRFLTTEAFSYLNNLKMQNQGVAKQVEEVILYLIVYRGYRQQMSQMDVRYIERQVRGEEPKIRIQRDGETSDFGAYVKEAIKKGSED
ncbi:MAG: DNA-binding protein [Candidatus Thorarchaeota archaeon]|jgi:DNA-binding TFAR19-related protein (PDSD5 family)